MNEIRTPRNPSSGGEFSPLRAGRQGAKNDRTGKRDLMSIAIRLGILLVLTGITPCRLAAATKPQLAAAEKALDIEMFKRELERSHTLAAKKSKDFRKRLKKLERMTRGVPSFPGPWMALAGMEEDAGNIRGAERDYLKALQVSDRWAGPVLAYAEYLVFRQRISDAVALLRTGLSTQPDNPAIVSALAEALQTQAPDEALRLWDGITQRDPERVDIAFKAASLEYARLHWKEAELRLRRLRDRRPQDPEVLSLLADASRKAGRDEWHDWWIRSALETGQCSNIASWIDSTQDRTSTDYRKALERAQRCPDVWMRRAEAEEATGDVEGAFSSYTEAYRLDPENKTVVTRLRMLAGQLLRPMPDAGPFVKVTDRKNLWEKAEAEMASGNWKKSFSTVKKLPFRHDAEFGKLFLLRMAEEAKGDAEILRWADSLARTMPREGSWVYSAALQAAGRASRADEMLRKASEEWPLDPFPCERLGRLRQGLRLWDQAARAYEEADRRDWRGRWLIEEARCQAEKGDWGRAARLYVAELDRRPMQPEAYRGMMTAYEKNGRPADALRAARLWSQTDPLSKEAWEAYRRLLGDSDPATASDITRIQKEL